MSGREPRRGPSDRRLVDLILDSVVEGVFTVDREFRITFFNAAAERITGFTAEEAVGRNCHDVFHATFCGLDCPLRQSLRAGRRVQNVEIDILSREGRRATISVCTAPLVDSSGAFQGGVETFRDVGAPRGKRRKTENPHAFHGIISDDPKMRQIFRILPNIAQSDATVLVQGRSGTGKELFANAIHEMSPRADGPLVTVNCGALPETLLESELFGYVRGAFTGAKQNRMGRFQAADGGTIFLDEIGDTPLPMQVKLLRVLEQREVQPLGSDRTETFDARVIAATNQDLVRMVAEGRFREDLFYRLNVVLIQVPELHERRDDIPLLVEHFIERFNERIGREVRGVSDEAMALLQRPRYAGNVRELENALAHAYIVSNGERIEASDLPPSVRDGTPSPVRVTAAASALPAGRNGSSSGDERQQIVDCLNRHFWSIPRAAKELGMHRTTLWRKVQRYRIERPDEG